MDLTCNDSVKENCMCPLGVLLIINDDMCKDKVLYLDIGSNCSIHCSVLEQREENKENTNSSP